MTITGQLSDSYSPSLLQAIEEAFDGVWATVCAHMPRDRDQSNELIITLRQTLVGLAADGITDPQELWRMALTNLCRTQGLPLPTTDRSCS